ncbi:hypothetical protein ACJMK2_021555 [Sinanodonta woodiana]|uniref:Uncharacterized protein n=1 Tax=Sinanodonta woodiana TaxID=1069815 RepID=A0ABD3TGE7_SINWO
MISIASTKPEFSVNFPSPVPVSELALAKLRVYHSWPNIRSEAFGGQQPNNSLVFAWKNKEDGTPDWQIVSLPTGSYQIEQINTEFQRRIKSLTGKESKIAISVHEPTLSSAIEISTEGYVVDIYRSSIRSILGWPERPLLENRRIPTPVPKKSDYVTDKIAPSNPIKSYIEYEKSKFFIGTIDGERLVILIDEDEITKNFTAMMDDLLLSLISIKSGTLTRDEFISVVEICNKIIDDAEIFHLKIIQAVLSISEPELRIEFARKFNIRVEEIPTFKLPNYPITAMKKSLSDAINEGFKKIHDKWVKKSKTTNTNKYFDP